jgi:hypothetical protein
MSLQQLRNVNFGRSKLNATGSLGVGYQILDVAGAIVSARTTTGVYQTAPGIYAVYATFTDNFRGQILWDTGTAFPTASYATEQYNVEENDPTVAAIYSQTTYVSGSITGIQGSLASMSSSIGQLYDIQYGRWKIDSNQMIFYKSDNLTEVARFNLFDDLGSPSMDTVFERVKV